MTDDESRGSARAFVGGIRPFKASSPFQDDFAADIFLPNDHSVAFSYDEALEGGPDLLRSTGGRYHQSFRAVAPWVLGAVAHFELDLDTRTHQRWLGKGKGAGKEARETAKARDDRGDIATSSASIEPSAD